MDGNSAGNKISYLDTVCTHLVIETQDFPDQEDDDPTIIRRESNSTSTNVSSCGSNLLADIATGGPTSVKGTIPVGKSCVDPFIQVGLQQVAYDHTLGGSYATCEVERPFV